MKPDIVTLILTITNIIVFIYSATSIIILIKKEMKKVEEIIEKYSIYYREKGKC